MGIEKALNKGLEGDRLAKPLALRRRHAEKGFVMYLMAAGAFAMIALAGLSVDVGYLQWQKRRVQSAADAAVVAAGKVAYVDGCTTVTSASCAPAFVAAKAVASLNGFTDTSYNNSNPNATVALNYNSGTAPPQLQAVVSYTAPVYFMHVFGTNSINVSAQSTVSYTPSSGGNGTGSGTGCMYALNPTASRAIYLTGSGTVLNSFCGVYSNSNSASAFYQDGNATLNLCAGSTLNVVGQASYSGQSYVNQYTTACSGGAQTGKFDTAVAKTTASFSDPLASVVAPTSSGMTVIAASGGKSYDMNSKPAGNTIQPGIYCGGLTINNTNGATFKFAAGTYVIAGGQFAMNGPATIDATAGVTFYFTNGSSANWGCSSSSNFSGVTISGSGTTFTQKAPTAGNLAGIAMFLDRSVGTSANSYTINGMSTTYIHGALYFKNVNLTYTGAQNNQVGYMYMVADTITLNGNSAVTVYDDYSTLPNSTSIITSN